jgi:peptidoglycan/LPS O-acetylase OafA/YrhL
MLDETPHQLRNLDTAPQEKLHLPALDGLRFLAFFAVLIHHMPPPSATPWLHKFHAYGWVGVELFFVISSFLFFYLFKAEESKTGRINIPAFYIRRVLRIYPLMILFPVIMLVFYGTTDAGLLRLAGLALFADNAIAWFNGYNVAIPHSAHLWTLSFEFQVYFFIPVAFIALRRMEAKYFVASLAAVFALCWSLRMLFMGLGAPHPIVWVTPFLHPDSVLFGILLSLGFFKRLPVWTLAVLFGLTGVAFLATPLPMGTLQGAALSYPLAAVMCASLVGISLRSPAIGKVLSWKPLAYLGSISFGLYVFHFFGMALAANTFMKLGWTIDSKENLAQWALSIVLTVAITTILAAASYYILERPFNQFKDRFATVKGR